MSDRFVEKHPIPTARLGRRAPDRRRIRSGLSTLRLGDILRAAPAHCPSADYLAPIKSWQMLGNDRWGVCGPISVANSRRIVVKNLLDQDFVPTQEQIFDLYRRSGNPTFDPKTGRGDDGVNMNEMLQACMAGGFAGVKPVAFASVDHNNQQECEAAIDLFGFLLLGADLQVVQQAQLEASPPLWDYRRSGAWGGHAVVAGAYTGSNAAKTADVSVVTWAKVVGTTDSFWDRQVEEAWVVIWPEHLGLKSFHSEIDTERANEIYTQLTGKPGPFPSKPTPPDPPSAPSPSPGATAADAQMWTVVQGWARTKGLT